jgi:hypothetical protein
LLRGREHIWKRYLINACAFNLSIIKRQLYRAGTLKGLEALRRLFLPHPFTLLVCVRPKGLSAAEPALLA